MSLLSVLLLCALTVEHSHRDWGSGESPMSHLLPFAKSCAAALFVPQCAAPYTSTAPDRECWNYSNTPSGLVRTKNLPQTLVAVI